MATAAKGNDATGCLDDYELHSHFFERCREELLSSLIVRVFVWCFTSGLVPPAVCRWSVASLDFGGTVDILYSFICVTNKTLFGRERYRQWALKEQTIGAKGTDNQRKSLRGTDTWSKRTRQWEWKEQIREWKEQTILVKWTDNGIERNRQWEWIGPSFISGTEAEILSLPF